MGLSENLTGLYIDSPLQSFSQTTAFNVCAPKQKNGCAAKQNRFQWLQFVYTKRKIDEYTNQTSPSSPQCFHRFYKKKNILQPRGCEKQKVKIQL